MKPLPQQPTFTTPEVESDSSSSMNDSGLPSADAATPTSDCSPKNQEGSGSSARKDCGTLVLGIDPGTRESAYVLWDGETILQHNKVDNKSMLTIVEGTADLEDVQCAIEMVQSFGMAVGKEVFNTVFWIGRFFEKWVSHCGEKPKPWMIYRPQVKKHFGVGNRGKDKDIRAALIERVGPQGKKKTPGPTFGVAGDVWSALAIAITRRDHLMQQSESSSRTYSLSSAPVSSGRPRKSRRIRADRGHQFRLL